MFWRLGYPSLMDPDEAHYAQLTREMLQAGNWLVPLLDGLPYIDKPVLFHWLQGASMTLLGESEFAARLPSAIAALGLFALTRWVGIALFGAAAGEWGAVMFATIPATFFLASIGLLDMVYTTFLFGGMGCLLVAMRDAAAARRAGRLRAAHARRDDQGARRAAARRRLLRQRVAGGRRPARIGRAPALENRAAAGRDRGGALVRLHVRRALATRSFRATCSRATCTTSRSRRRFPDARSATSITRASSPAASFRGA